MEDKFPQSESQPNGNVADARSESAGAGGSQCKTVSMPYEIDEVARTALVTGVGGYIGSEVAAALRKRGFDVWGIDRTQPAGAVWRGRFIEANLGHGDSIPSFEVPVAALDCVIHVAGGALAREVLQEHFRSELDLIDETFRDNFLSAVDVIEATRGALRQGGSILLTSSINALGSYGLPIYSASKAALHGFTKGLAPELAAAGIRLNVAVLGTVDHPGVRKLHEADPGHFERLQRSIPGGRLLNAPEVAEQLVRMSSNEDLRGEIIVIDNGQLAGGANSD